MNQKIEPFHESFQGYHIQVFGGTNVNEDYRNISKKSLSPNIELSDFVDFGDTHGVMGFSFNPFVEITMVHHPYYNAPTKHFMITTSFEETSAKNLTYDIIQKIGFQQSELSDEVKKDLKQRNKAIFRSYLEIYSVALMLSKEPRSFIPFASYFKFLLKYKKTPLNEIRDTVKKKFQIDEESLDQLFLSQNLEGRIN